MCDCGNPYDDHEIIFRAPEDKIIEDFLQEEINILNDEWERSSQEALDKALGEFKKQRDPKDGIEEFLTFLLLGLSTVVSPSKQEEYLIVISGLYEYFKTRSALEFKSSITFKEIDKQLVRAFANDGPYWINNFYNKFLSERISIVSRDLLNRGLNKQQIATELEKIISKELSLRDGTRYAQNIPKKFAGHVEAYNEIITSTSVQRIRSFTDIITIYNAGYQQFIYTAILDKRTCARCVQLDGSVWSVPIAYNKVEAVAYADSPEEFTSVMPWYNTVAEVQNLTSNQVPIPPIHGRCRCLVRVL